MFDSSSYVNPTPLAHADTSRDVLPRGEESPIPRIRKKGFTLGNSTPSLGEFAGSKSALLRGLRIRFNSRIQYRLPIVDQDSDRSRISSVWIPPYFAVSLSFFPKSLKGPYNGSLKNPVFFSDSLTPLISSLSCHHSPNHPSVISCSSSAPVGLSPLDL
ncbi:hypothetical protein TNCV_2543251 [Trichonephila clavipes]|nr:hypothetical protein TNCV_2543251 [Trichonephila clavipes]